ncbi:MAG: transketolase C-terminal domain-containing protein, partial [Terracidiphilus sp.]
TRLDEDCRDQGEDVSIIACGPEVPEAMRAAWILRQEYGYTTRILNMHTLKPIDREAIVRAALETGAIVTAEEHQIGALAGRVSSVLTESPRLYGHPFITAAIGVKDRFGDSGAPWELVKELEVSAEHIAVKAAELMAHKHEPAGVSAHRGA